MADAIENRLSLSEQEPAVLSNREEGRASPKLGRRAIVVGGKLACLKQSIRDLRRPTHRHDDVLRRTFLFGMLAVIKLQDDPRVVIQINW